MYLAAFTDDDLQGSSVVVASVGGMRPRGLSLVAADLRLSDDENEAEAEGALAMVGASVSRYRVLGSTIDVGVLRQMLASVSLTRDAVAEVDEEDDVVVNPLVQSLPSADATGSEPA